MEESAGQEGVKKTIHSVEEYIDLDDNHYLNDERKDIVKRSDSVKIYDSFLKQEIPRLYALLEYDVRMALGWIDEDIVPELFLCQANATASGIKIYTIDQTEKSVVFLGEFSQFGKCIFTEKKNRIWSQYGNQGHYQQCVSMIENGRTRVLGAILEDGGGEISEDVLYYAGFPIPKDLTGTREDLDIGLRVFDRPGAGYLVDEESYREAYHKLMRDKEDGAVSICMDHGYMVVIDP